VRAVKKAIVYVAIRGDQTGKFYVYKYRVASPASEEGCGIACNGCDGHKAWYEAVPQVLEKVRSRYGEVELRTHFRGLTKADVGVEVRYVDKKDNLALKGIDKCLAKYAAQPASHAAHSQADPHGWQYEFLDEFGMLLTVEDAPAVVALSAPTGSGKTKAALEASKLAVDKGFASLAVAVGRTKTQHEAFIRDNERFGVGFVPVRFPSKESACIQIRMAPPPPPDWDEEEQWEYLGMLARRAKCGNCPLNSFTSSVGLDALRRIVVETTIKKRNEDDERYVEELEKKLREEIQRERGSVEAERGNVCAYSATKNAAAYIVKRGEPLLAVGTYAHVFSQARVLLLDICNKSSKGEEERTGLEDDYEDGKAPKYPVVKKLGCPAVVVVDEAHNLWKVVIDFNKYSISSTRILNVAKDLAAFCEANPGERWCKKLNEVDGVLRGSADVLGKLAELNSSRKTRRDAEVKVLEPPDGLVETAEKLSATLEEICRPYLDEAGDLNLDDPRIARAYTLMKTAKRFLKVLKGEETRWGIYSLVNKKQRSFVLLPIDLRGIVGRTREVFHGPWVLLSGTLSRNEIEDLLGEEIYLHRASVEFGKLTVRFAVSSDPNLLTTRYDVGRNEDMYQKYATAISRVLRGAAGPLRLVVYPSYSVMNAVRKYYVPPGDAVELWEKPGEKFKAEIEKLVNEGKLVNLHAVAHGSLVEGIEFKLRDGKSAIGTVVVAGVPVPNIFSDYYVDVAKHFGYLDHKCAEALHRAPDFAEAPEECRIKMIKWGYALAEATLKQIIGRAIRGPQDSASLYLLDTRVAVVPRLRDALCRGLHYDVKCADISAEDLLSTT